jgi:zinc protease
VTAFEQGRTQPQSLAFNRFQRAFAPYPSDDVRYVPTIDERLERTRKLTIEQVRTLHREYLGADHGELVMIGDFEPSEVLPILGKTLEGWKAAKPYARIERPIPPGLKPETATIETPDKPNAVYIAGLVDPVKDSDPDYPALIMGDYILGGGGLSSRIANRLRQKDGVSYNAMSMFVADPLDSHAALMILAIYNPINVQKVKTGVIEEVNRLIKDGVTAEELKAAQVGYLRQEQNQRADDSRLGSILAEDLYLGRTMEFQADLERKIRDLTPEAVNAALRKYLDPERLTVVTVGDFQKKK